MIYQRPKIQITGAQFALIKEGIKPIGIRQDEYDEIRAHILKVRIDKDNRELARIGESLKIKNRRNK